MWYSGSSVGAGMFVVATGSACATVWGVMWLTRSWSKLMSSAIGRCKRVDEVWAVGFCASAGVAATVSRSAGATRLSRGTFGTGTAHNNHPFKPVQVDSHTLEWMSRHGAVARPGVEE